jgi:hypothetical protein
VNGSAVDGLRGEGGLRLGLAAAAKEEKTRVHE